MIPFLDLKRQYQTIKSEIEPAIQTVIDNTAFSGGVFVEKFEKEFADYCGVQYCSGVNSGTSALHLALLALDIGADDEVILPANTFIATAWAPAYVGATPVFADCDPNTWNIDIDSVISKITSKTKAIIGVHLYGCPFDVKPLVELCVEHNIALVEDAAQAHGATYRGKAIGGLGTIACFSHYPGKNLGAYGEGGAVTSNNSELIQRINLLKNHASHSKYEHHEVGYNMRMDGIQAAVLGVKLRHLDEWNNKRKSIAKRYNGEINNPKIKMQLICENDSSSYHLFVITTLNRDDFTKHLEQNNIGFGYHYPIPCHLQKAFAHLNYKTGSLPSSEYHANHCVTLPMFAELTDDEVTKVIEVINRF